MGLQTATEPYMKCSAVVVSCGLGEQLTSHCVHRLLAGSGKYAVYLILAGGLLGLANMSST